MTLNSRQLKFAQEYWASGNGTQSAINAGYSKRTAHSQATRLLKHAKVRAKIKEYEKESRAELQQQFSRDAIEAREIMFNIMQDELAPESVRLSAAKDFMDRAGFKPIEKQETQLSGGVEVSDPFKGLTTEELRRLAGLND